jgi:phage virion morphogenesis protein
MITIKIDDRSVLHALGRLQTRTGDLTDVMHDIGEYLTETTKRRFDTITAPDGRRWAHNSQTTILRYLGSFSTSFSKQKGKITKAGVERAVNKKPLTGRSGMQASLGATIGFMAGKNFVEIGSQKEYAAVQQIGAKKHAFGKSPWGDIPARPFLGISDQDRTDILDTISDYLSNSFRP